MSAIVAACLASCRSSTLEPLPFEVALNLSRTSVARGDTVIVTVDVQGGLLVGVTVNYGDMSTDAYDMRGARTGHVEFRHAFASTGTFQVTATVTDAVAGEKTASADVVVQ